MEKTEVKERYDELMSIKDDPYGLRRITARNNSTNMIEEQVTKFDSFIQEDSLRYFINMGKLDEIKKSMDHRVDEKTGLYEVTFGDKNPSYYDFATMFNRLTDPVYSKKVYRAVKLLGEYSKMIKSQYNSAIEDNNRANARYDSGDTPHGNR